MAEDLLQNLLYSYAFNIMNGQAGGDYIYSLQENCIYFYEDNVWKKLFDKEFLDRIEKNLIPITRFSLNQKKEIVENFKHKKYLRLEGFNKTDLINFENCMFNPITLEATEHKKEYYSTIRIPYKYEPSSICPLWIKTLKEIFENDEQKIKVLQDFFGYCLTPENNQKKALLLLGETDTGKSTILFILKDLLGQENVSNVPLEYLSHPQYTPLLINKIVNIDADVSKEAAKYEREFKIITSGEAVSCNQKHIPTFEFIPKCKIILAANIFPRITDHSSAFYQRLILIPAERRFSEKEKNRELNKQLKAELSGIFNWAIEGLKSFRLRGQFEQYDFMKDAVEELETDNNPSNVFFEEHIEICMGSEIEKGELFKRYQEWAKETENYTLNSARFSTAVYKKYSVQTPKKAQGKETGKRVWRNIKYVHFKRQLEYSQEIISEEE